MTTQTKVITPIDSAYFGEEDVMALQTSLIEEGCIDPDPGYLNNFELMNPVFLAKALDRLIDGLIEEIMAYPGEMLFNTQGGCFGSEFERAVRAVKASGMTKEELRAMR